MIDDNRLAERLRDADLLSAQKLEEAKGLQDREDRSLYEVLVAHEFVDEGPLVAIVSDVLNVAAVDPRDFDPDGEILDLVPAAIAFDNGALPLQTERADGQNRLVLAMRDPIDMMAMDEIANYIDIDIRPVLAGPRALHAALVDSYDHSEPFELEADEASASDGLDTSTHPGLVTSGATPNQPSEATDEQDDEEEKVDEPLDTEVESGVFPSGDFADSNPAAPVESDLASNSAPEEEELATDSAPESEGQAIGRIPVKQVPASELAEDSSSPSPRLADSSSNDAAASEDALEPGSPVPIEDEDEAVDPTTESSTAVAEAPQVGQPDESSTSAPSRSTPDEAASGIPLPPDDEPSAPANDGGSEFPQADESEDSDEGDVGDEESKDEDDSPLSDLRRRLKKDSSGSPLTSTSSDDEESTEGFVAQVAEIADELDDEGRERLASASGRDLAEAAVLALLDNGALSVADLLDGLDDN